jgi:hypothetical protein
MGHEFGAVPSSAQADHWCPECAGVRRGSLDELRALGNRVRRGGWCPHCAGRLRLTTEEMQALARERAGLVCPRCISTRRGRHRSRFVCRARTSGPTEHNHCTWVMARGRLSSAQWSGATPSSSHGRARPLRDVGPRQPVARAAGRSAGPSARNPSRRSCATAYAIGRSSRESRRLRPRPLAPFARSVFVAACAPAKHPHRRGAGSYAGRRSPWFRLLHSWPARLTRAGSRRGIRARAGCCPACTLLRSRWRGRGGIRSRCRRSGSRGLPRTCRRPGCR